MSAIRKAIIPAAGFGTRMLPVAKAVPKEMLPILDRPAIQYVVEEAADAGIDDVLLIVSREKRAIEDHFDRNAELERRLAQSGRSELLSSVVRLQQRVQIHSVRQAEQRGLGHAVAQAERHVGDDPFLCLLGDTIFGGAESASRQLIEAHEELDTPLIGLVEVPPHLVNRYGIAVGEFVGDGVMRIDRLIEKPSPQETPGRFAIAARYVLTPDIFECLRQTRPGAGDEIQLTDAMQILLKKRPIHGIVMKSRRHDIGNILDWLNCNLVFAARDPALWKEVAASVKLIDAEASRRLRARE